MLERCLLIHKFFMNFIKGDRHVTSINHVNDTFEFFTEAIKDFINEIFFIKEFSKKSKFISLFLINCIYSEIVLEPLTQFFTWFLICLI